MVSTSRCGLSIHSDPRGPRFDSWLSHLFFSSRRLLLMVGAGTYGTLLTTRVLGSHLQLVFIAATFSFRHVFSTIAPLLNQANTFISSFIHHTCLSLLLFGPLLSLPLPTTPPREPATSTNTATGPDRTGRVHDAAVRSPEGSRVDAPVLVGVDAEPDPGEDALLERLADEGVAQDRVVAVGALAEQEVVDVLGRAHPVGVVGRDLVDGGQEGLVKVELADVRGLAACDGVVCLLGCAEVDDCWWEGGC